MYNINNAYKIKSIRCEHLLNHNSVQDRLLLDNTIWQQQQHKEDASRTFSPHADFEAFLEATVLALVTVVLVHGTVPVGPAGVWQVPPDAAFKEALTSFTCELSVVLPAGFIPTHDAFDLLVLLFVHGRGGRRGRGCVVVVGGSGAGRIGRRCALVCFCCLGYFQRRRRVHVSRMLPGQRQRSNLGHRGGEGPLRVPDALGVSPRYHSHVDSLWNFERPTFLFSQRQMNRTIWSR